MKLSQIVLILTAAFCFSNAIAAFGQDTQPDPSLKTGDDAPALSSGEFIKGEPVKSLEKGKSYVVEFWATWCGPCKMSIPHLTEMQAKYKDIIFIGQDCLEQNVAGVKPFVETMGDKMNYRVAMDNPSGMEGSMFTSWMKASGSQGIPTAFLVDKQGKIAYIGHPMTLDKVLESYTAGTFDVKKEAAKKAVEDKMQKELSSALQSGDMDAAINLVDKYAKSNPEEAGQLNTLKFHLLV